MLVIGITNKLPHGLRLFMYEYDNIEEYDVLEDANFLSEVFDIDIYVLESSRGGYHLISFDVLTLDMVNRIQEWSMYHGDYLSIKELPLYDDKGLWNTLRVGNKGKKANPRFLKVFYAKHDRNLKSKQHLNLYQFFCGIPEPPLEVSVFFVNLNYMMFSVYNTGIGAKPRIPLKRDVNTRIR